MSHGVRYRLIFHPVALVPGFNLACFASEQGSGRIRGFRTDSFQSLELGRDVVPSRVIPTLIQGDDADMVPSDKVGVAFGVIQCESKDAVEVLEKVGSLVLVSARMTSQSDCVLNE